MVVLTVIIMALGESPGKAFQGIYKFSVSDAAKLGRGPLHLHPLLPVGAVHRHRFPRRSVQHRQRGPVLRRRHGRRHCGDILPPSAGHPHPRGRHLLHGRGAPCGPWSRRSSRPSRGISEVITTIMFNNIALALVNFLVNGPLSGLQEGTSLEPQMRKLLPTALFGKLNGFFRSIGWNVPELRLPRLQPHRRHHHGAGGLVPPLPHPAGLRDQGGRHFHRRVALRGHPGEQGADRRLHAFRRNCRAHRPAGDLRHPRVLHVQPRVRTGVRRDRNLADREELTRGDHLLFGALRVSQAGRLRPAAVQQGPQLRDLRDPGNHDPLHCRDQRDPRQGCPRPAKEGGGADGLLFHRLLPCQRAGDLLTHSVFRHGRRLLRARRSGQHRPGRDHDRDRAHPRVGRHHLPEHLDRAVRRRGHGDARWG